MKDIWRRLARPGVDQRRKHPLEPASPKRAIAASADQAPPPNEGAFDGQAEQESSAPGWSSVEEVSEALVAVRYDTQVDRAGHPRACRCIQHFPGNFADIRRGAAGSPSPVLLHSHRVSYERLTWCGARIGAARDCGNSRGGRLAPRAPDR